MIRCESSPLKCIVQEAGGQQTKQKHSWRASGALWMQLDESRVCALSKSQDECNQRVNRDQHSTIQKTWTTGPS